jgi:hypothetical protein
LNCPRPLENTVSSDPLGLGPHIMNGGERAWTIDEVPLDWFYRPGVKLDLAIVPMDMLSRRRKCQRLVGGGGNFAIGLPLVRNRRNSPSRKSA